MLVYLIHFLSVAHAIWLPTWDHEGTLPSSFDYKGQQRTFKVLVPGHYEKLKNCPLIFWFHGAGGSAALTATEISDFTQRALADGYVIVLPEAAPTFNSTAPLKERNWNSGLCCGAQYVDKVDDVGMIEYVFRYMLNNYRIDPDQVFLQGESNGAGILFRLICELNHEFKLRAAAPLVGSFQPKDGQQCQGTCYTDPRYPVADVGPYCLWDTELPNCGPKDWHNLPDVYTCDRWKTENIPLLVMNGLLDHCSDIRGQVWPLDDDSAPHANFPPMHMANSYLRDCDIERISYQNNERVGNGTVCYSWDTHSSGSACQNYTYCEVEAQHCWYGETDWDFTHKIWDIFNFTDKDKTEAVHYCGQNSPSFSATDQILNFFDSHRKKASTFYKELHDVNARLRDLRNADIG